MRQTGIAQLPLHGGKAPVWLFQRMVRLGGEITRLIIENDGPRAFLQRIADPYWLQSLGCVLGFDWHSSGVTTTVCGALKDVLTMTLEPHTAICSNLQKERALNLVALDSQPAQSMITNLSHERPEKLIGEIQRLQTLSLPSHHQVSVSDIHPKSIEKILLKTYERKATNFEELLSMPGVGAKTLRALTLIADLAYGTAASWKDPVKFSFAHGGKDGNPYPVDCKLYDESVEFLRRTVERARIDKNEKENALKRLQRLFPSEN